MKKFTLLIALMCMTVGFSQVSVQELGGDNNPVFVQQSTSQNNVMVTPMQRLHLEQLEIQAAANRSVVTGPDLNDLLQRYEALDQTALFPKDAFTALELQVLKNHFRSQNRNPEADFIPTAGATETFTPAVGDSFFDPGGPGGSNTDGDPGNYPNCACVTTTTLDGVTDITFNAFIVFATFDWLKIYDGPDTSGTILYDNAAGGINAGDIMLADMIASNGSASFSGTSGALTFEFNATGVVNREGWDVTIDALGGGGGGGTACDQSNPTNAFENAWFSGGQNFPDQVIATDITVGADEDFEMTGLNAELWAVAGATIVSADVVVYGDAGGVPDSGNIIDTQLGVTPLSSPNIGNNFGFDIFDTDLDITPVMLPGQPGVSTTYWVSIFITTSDNGDTGWGATSVSSNGFETGVSQDGGITWTNIAGNDQVYVISGTCTGGGGGGGGGDPVAYGFESQTPGYVSLDPAAPATFTVISGGSGTAAFESSGAEDPNNPGTAYAGDNVGDFWSVDVETGVYTFLGNHGIADATGFEFDPVSGTLYMVTLTELYTIDPAGPTATLVGGLGTAGAVAIALGIDGGGNAFTYDIADDTFYSVDLGTGAATAIGPIGFDAAFGQGMTWDPNTDTMYMAAFNNVSFDAEMYTVDTATGATTLVGGINPGTLNQLAWLTIPSAGPVVIVCNSTPYDSADVPFDIDGAGSTTADCAAAPNLVNVNVAELGTIGVDGEIESVVVDISHTWSGDLELSLVAPSGAELVLADNLTGNTDDAYNGTTFEDGGLDIAAAAMTGVQFGVGPYAPQGGTFAAAFDGESITGDWSLKICDTASGDTGTVNQFTLNLCVPDQPNNDECIDAFPVACGDVVVGETLSDTDSGGNPAPDEWYSFTGSGDVELVTVSLCDGGTDYDSLLRIFDACDGTEIATNDDACGLQSEVQFVSDGTTTYYIMVEGFASNAGNFSMEITCEEPLPNDFCDGAIAVECGDSVTGTTIGATIDTDVAPDCDTSVTSPGVWYVYEDTNCFASDITVSLCAGGTDYDSKLSVYTGDCGAPPLTCVVGNDDSCGLQSEVSFNSPGGQTYYILVHGFGGSTGNFSLDIQCTPVAPANDMIANAIDVDQIGFPYTDADVSLPGATTEGANPNGCNIDGVTGVWYKFTAEGDGSATASIPNPSGVSVVQFYEAPNESATVTDLTLVDFIDNQCVPGSEASIVTEAGQTYYVLVMNSGDCTDVTIDGINLGLGDNVIEGFTFFPNPANDVLNLSSRDQIETVSIFNILGQKVIDMDVNATNSRINISELSTGTYVMKVSVDGQLGTYKVIKN